MLADAATSAPEPPKNGSDNLNRPKRHRLNQRRGDPMDQNFSLIQSRLEPYGLRMYGDRGRAACPVCGGRNKSTLSLGTTADGAVLVTCFKSGCSIESITAALGVEVADLFPPREASPVKRRRML